MERVQSHSLLQRGAEEAGAERSTEKRGSEDVPVLRLPDATPHELRPEQESFREEIRLRNRK